MTTKKRPLLLLHGALWLSLVTCLVHVSSFSIQSFHTNGNPRGKIRSFASPEATTTRRPRGPQTVTVVSSSSSSAAGNGGDSRRNQSQQPRPSIPLVDSTLLRFLNSQKTTTLVPTPPPQDDTLSSVSPQQQADASNVASVKAKEDTIQQQEQATTSTSSSSSSWLGQYNRHLVASSLLLELQGVSESLAYQAGDAVQRHVLARTARRRIRLFLKKRDKLWNNTNAVTNNNNNGNMALQEDDNSIHSYSSDLNQVIALLTEKGLTGTDICTILSHTPSVALMRPTTTTNDSEEQDMDETTLDSTVTRAFTGVLSESLKLRKYDARKVLRNCPGLLTARGSKNAQHVVTLLAKMGVSQKSLARDKTALPVLLSRSPAALFQLVAFLSSDAVRMNVQTIGPLLRKADCAPLLNAVAPVPRLQQDAEAYVLDVNNNDSDEDDPSVAAGTVSWGRSSQERRQQIQDTYRQMSVTAWTLRHEIGTRDLGKVIAAYPSVLLLDAGTQILPVASYLMNDLGIWQDDLPRVLQLYPVLLGMDVNDMKRVVAYLLSLEVAEENLASIFRAFPSLFTLDIEKDMEPVVQFLREIGITNVGRFITRLPPVLGYSVEDELVPKWEYLCRVCTQGSFELSTFPAYFSYPLEKRIKTRYQYLQQVKGIPTQLLALDRVLRYGDRDFATRVAHDTDDGAAFLAFCKEKQQGGAADGRAVRRKRAPAKSPKPRGVHRKSANKRI